MNFIEKTEKNTKKYNSSFGGTTAGSVGSRGMNFIEKTENYLN